MSRLTLACSFVLALSSSLVPAASAGGFAQPPPATPHSAIGTPPVATHAGLVAPAFDRATLRAKLLQNRAANLARFRAYQEAGVFPSNVYKAGELNVWRDQAGHFCAAATIIRMSGQTELVERVADDNNFIRLADVEQGPLMDWILMSGLTQEEIVMIQKPFRPVTIKPVAEPQDLVVVDDDMRAAETHRLAALYKQIDARLVAARNASIDLALARLMRHPELAAQLL